MAESELDEEAVVPRKKLKLDEHEPEICSTDKSVVGQGTVEAHSHHHGEEKKQNLNQTDYSSDLQPRASVNELNNEPISSAEGKSECQRTGAETVGVGGKTLVHRTEQEVGITEFVSRHEGFSGTLKQRYSDFLVNERDLEGNTVHLTSTDLPPEFVKEKLESSVLSVETIKKLEDLVHNEDKTVKVVVQVEDDKEKRTLVHREIREKFPILESDTADVDSHKVVRAFHHVPNDKKRRRKPDWPKDRGEYCHFLLYKENKDTMQAINLLAKCIKVKPDRFAYAGTKDGRAVTVQRVSVFRVDARKLQGLNKVLYNMCVGNFEFKTRPLKLGDLRGNTFVIVLRNVTGSKQQIEAAMSSLRDVGFINYYGLQRFGTSATATHSIGLLLLKSQWSEAVDLILTSRSERDDKLSQACQCWKETRDAKAALKILDGKKFLESFLLEGLAKCGEKDFVAALKHVPRNTRLMYVHAYQSYIWNTVVSRRVKEFGLKPVVGDLVFSERSAGGKMAEKDGSTNGQPTEVAVKALTEQDLGSGSYAIHDVIMPLPGYDVEYPEHNGKVWYETLLAADELDIKNMRHKVKDYSLSGAYRHVIVRPDLVEWNTFRYNDPTIPLLLTDLGRLRGDSEPVSEDDGKYEALRVTLSLQSSSYATMAVREILKTETSPSFHSSLNDY